MRSGSRACTLASAALTGSEVDETLTRGWKPGVPRAGRLPLSAYLYGSEGKSDLAA